MMNHFMNNFLMARKRKLFNADAMWFTLLRDPVSFFESTYAYYKANELIGVNFKTFVSNYRLYLPRLRARGQASYHFLFSLETNLGFRFGSRVTRHGFSEYNLICIKNQSRRRHCGVLRVLSKEKYHLIAANKVAANKV